MVERCSGESNKTGIFSQSVFGEHDSKLEMRLDGFEGQRASDREGSETLQWLSPLESMECPPSAKSFGA